MIAPAFPPTSSWRPREASRPSPANPASTVAAPFAGRATSACGRPSPPSPTTRATARPGRRRSTSPRAGGGAVLPIRSAPPLPRGFVPFWGAGAAPREHGQRVVHGVAGRDAAEPRGPRHARAPDGVDEPVHHPHVEDPREEPREPEERADDHPVVERVHVPGVEQERVHGGARPPD